MDKEKSLYFKSSNGNKNIIRNTSFLCWTCVYLRLGHYDQNFAR